MPIERAGRRVISHPEIISARLHSCKLSSKYWCGKKARKAGVLKCLEYFVKCFCCTIGRNFSSVRCWLQKIPLKLECPQLRYPGKSQISTFLTLSLSPGFDCITVSCLTLVWSPNRLWQTSDMGQTRMPVSTKDTFRG